MGIRHIAAHGERRGETKQDVRETTQDYPDPAIDNRD